MANGESLSMALVQMTSVDHLLQNENFIFSTLKEIENHQPVDFILFPENSLYMRITEGEAIKPLSLKDPVFEKLSEYSQRQKCMLHLTTALADLDRISNASIGVFPDGRVDVLYRKIHLFDIELEGQKPIRESDVFAAGEGPQIFEYKGFRFGSSICYDIRFSELYLYYTKKDVDALVVPSAFLVPTGEAHWQSLLRARAIESQCYVLAAAQWGIHKSTRTEQTRKTYGHSMLIGPWGEVLQMKSDGVGVIFGHLQKKDIHRVRTQIPMKNHRRL